MTHSRFSGFLFAAIVCVGVGLFTSSSFADDPPKLGWGDKAELGYVFVDGNAQSSSLGFKNELTYRWEKALFTFRVGAVRAKTTDITREAVGTPDDFTVITHETDRVAAENYFANVQYDRTITERFYWFVGAGWDRNKPSGIENRYTGVAGVGNIWVDTEKIKFKTNYGLSYTSQEDSLGDTDSFAGARFSWDYLHKFGANTTYQNLFIFDLNVEETSDWRGDMINSLAVAMSKSLALKLSLQWLYDNEPALIAVDLAGSDPPTKVSIEADELDTIFTASLVMTF